MLTKKGKEQYRMIENEEEKKVRIRNKINKVIFSEVDLKEVEAITQNHTNIRI